MNERQMAQTETKMAEDPSRSEFFKQVFGGSWITQGIWVAAELGVADLLTDAHAAG